MKTRTKEILSLAGLILIYILLVTMCCRGQNVTFIADTVVSGNLTVNNSIVHILQSDFTPGANVSISANLTTINNSRIAGECRITATPETTVTDGPYNWIVNGGMEDSDNDGIADHWQVGPFTNITDVEHGNQYAGSFLSACQQVKFWQDVIITEAKDVWRLSFDLACKTTVQVCVHRDNNHGYLLADIAPSSSTRHYSLLFNYTVPTLYSIQFITIGGVTSWIKIDNVQLTRGAGTTKELTELTELTTATNDPARYFDLTGHEIDAPLAGYYVKVENGTGRVCYK